MGSLGIYFGSKEIAIVETAGKKVINNIIIPQKAPFAGELEEKTSVEARIIETTGLINSELKKNNISAKEATLCLSGKDLIVRTFEMAVLPKQELETAIDFEAKKYLPFKAEELRADYQVELDKATRMNAILFMGIKGDMLERYLSIFSQLSIKISAVEYAGFSILRAVKLSGLDDKGLKAVVVADVQAQDEINFVVIDDGFPVFSRDISLAMGPADAARAVDAGVVTAVEKLKTEIRVSLDYFRRKFPTRTVQEVFFAIDTYHRQEIEAFIAELGLTAKFIDIGKSIGKPVPYSSAFLKGFTASASGAINTPVKLNLLKAKSKAKAVGFQQAKEQPFSSEPFSIAELFNLRIFIIGALACLAAFGYGVYLKQPINKDIENIISERMQVPNIEPAMDYKLLLEIKAKFEAKMASLTNLVDKQVFVTEILSALPKDMPEGIWLEDFSFDNREGRRELSLKGMVYRPEEEEEFDAANKFLADLKRNPKFAQYFDDIKFVSLDRGEFIKFAVLKFSISCRSTQTTGRARR